MNKSLGSEGLADYLARLPDSVANITLTIQMMRDLTGRPFSQDEWTPGEAVDTWEVVEAIPNVGLALRRTED